MKMLENPSPLAAVGIMLVGMPVIAIAITVCGLMLIPIGTSFSVFLAAYHLREHRGKELAWKLTLSILGAPFAVAAIVVICVIAVPTLTCLGWVALVYGLAHGAEKAP